jgi:hypothetical protein
LGFSVPGKECVVQVLDFFLQFVTRPLPEILNNHAGFSVWMRPITVVGKITNVSKEYA